MIGRVETSQPTIDTQAAANGNEALSRALRDIAAYTGHAVTAQTKDGKQVPIRVDTESGTLQAYINNQWTDINKSDGSSRARASTQAGFSSVQSLVIGTLEGSLVAKAGVIQAVAPGILSDDLNADMLDGQHGAYYATATHNHDTNYVGLPENPTASGGALSSYVSGAFGFDTAAHAQEIHTLLQNIRTALVAVGIMT